MRNSIEFEVYGDYALFTDPLTKLGERSSLIKYRLIKLLKGLSKAFTGSLH